MTQNNNVVPLRSSTPSAPGRKHEPWSYSKLKAFELCPSKWAAESYYKVIKIEDTDQTSYGKDVHKAFEMRVKKRKPLPLDLRHHEPVVSKLLSLGGEALTEVRIGINRKFDQVDFFADDVWGRAVIDLILYNEEQAVIVDWKTGKVRPDFDQLDIMAAMTRCLIPTLEKVTGMFYWTKEKKIDKKTYSGMDFTRIWHNFIPRVQRFQEAIDQKCFPAQQNFLCAKYCRVTGCKHHGTRS